MKKISFRVLFVLLICLNVFAEPVEDNSFLVEEAYNQEPGVVQFINVYQKAKNAKDWVYVFINEIPVLSQTHQFSYEIPYAYVEGSDKTGLGDIKLNYRNEFYRNDILVSTGRISWVTSTGSSEDGLGSGSNGFEISLINSVKVTGKWLQHWNVGASYAADSKNSVGDKADNSKYFWNLSNVYIFTDNLNFMLEMTTSTSEETVADKTTVWATSTIVSPSVRYAFDVGEWQFVPGLALPFNVGENAGLENQTLVYLSIEGKMW